MSRVFYLYARGACLNAKTYKVGETFSNLLFQLLTNLTVSLSLRLKNPECDEKARAAIHKKS